MPDQTTNTQTTEPAAQTAQTETTPAAQQTAEPKPTTEPKKASEPKENSPSAEELAEFRKWQESQRSDAEKHAAALSKAEKARTAAEDRASAAELKLTAMRKGASADALEDVIALAKTKITDKVDAEQAIDEILKKYPAFSAQPKSVTTGTATQNNAPSTDTDDAKIRRVMGLPEKK